jgi:eukaryotic-like serine/threonine-protein kinase
MDLEPGQSVGPYVVEALLGRGGMGAVYRARDGRLGRQVALKFLQADGPLAGDDRRLLREARAASALSHPNICQVFDVGGDAGRAWIAMEYVEGRSLADSLPPGGLPPGEVIPIATALAGALAHAHQRGILHRDLKPSNVVCDRDGRPKVLDFGIASRLPHSLAQEITQTGTAPVPPALEGSLAYMAPEILRGELPDERADLWSLGVLLYELLTGTLPFRGRSTLEVASAILEAPVPPLPPHVPAPLARLVMRLLAKARSERFGSAADVGVALEAIAVRDTPSGVRGHALVAVMLVALVGAAGYLLWRANQFAPLVASEHRLISTAEASHRAPSFSPQGDQVALVVPDAEGVPQIRVVDIARGTSIPITSGDLPASRPRWSPRGDEIVYVRQGEGIWSVSPLGGTPRRLLASGTNPNFSADGARLVFEDQRDIWTAAADGSHVVRIDGTPPLYYGLPRGPAFSPDGSQIVYFQAEVGPNGDLWVIPAEGGTASRLTWDLREGGWPVWTPDGRAIIYSSARAGSRTLWQVPAAGGEPVALTTGAGEDDQPDITADGTRVTYTNVRNTWNLRVRDLAAGTERSLLQRGVEMQFPAFSPDGSRIAFFGRADYAVAIFTIAPDGSDLRQLTFGRELNHQPRWGPDGQDIYFFQVSPELSFRRVPALGGPSSAFRPWDWMTMNAPHFDPTGQFIALVRQASVGAQPVGPHQTIVHEVESGRDRDWPEPHFHPTGWSHDSQSLVGWREDGSIVICRVEDVSCRALTKGAHPVWPRGASRVYFARPQNSAAPQDLWSIALDGTDERHEAHMGTFRSIDRYFAVSQGGQAAWANFEAGRHAVWTARVK